MNATMVTAGVLALTLVALSGYVIAGRVSFRVDIGDGDNELLRRRIRVQANFVEYVPLALVLLMLVETAAIGPAWLPSALGATLVAGRLLHVQGLLSSSGVSLGRFAGTNLTALVLLTGALACLGRGLAVW